jgi:hypothetical protein
MLHVRKILRLGGALLAALLCLAAGSTSATTFLTLQSTYLGNGSFQYQMNLMDDPFFAEADITGLEVPFTNEISQTCDPAHWAYDDTYAYGWDLTNYFASRPNQSTFTMQSTETSYRLGNYSPTNYDGACVLMSLVFSDFNPGWNGIVSANVVGTAMLPCLEPCDAADADGSPTNFVYAFKIIPDIVINQLLQTNGVVCGVDFTWDDTDIFVLQGSSDLYNWTNIAYITSTPPDTVWTTNVSLSNYGQFFRVALTSQDYPMVQQRTAKTAIAPSPSSPQVTACKAVNGKFVVSLTAQTGSAVQLQAMDWRGKVKQTQQVTMQAGSTTVNFDPASLPNPVFFRASAVP